MIAIDSPSMTPSVSTSLPLDAHRMRPDAVSLHGHLLRCERESGRWFGLRCMAESVHGFLAPRFVTTLAFALTVMLSVAIAT